MYRRLRIDPVANTIWAQIGFATGSSLVEGIHKWIDFTVTTDSVYNNKCHLLAKPTSSKISCTMQPNNCAVNFFVGSSIDIRGRGIGSAIVLNCIM